LTRWRIIWTKSARNYYLKMDGEYQDRFQKAVRELERVPFSGKNIKRLHGELEGLYRFRVGRFRMVFRIIEESGEVRILAIASRGDAYK